MNKKIWMIILMFIIMVCIVGCSKVQDSVGEKIADKVVDETTKKIGSGEEISMEIDSSLTESVEIPKDFPKDVVPIYEKAHVFGVTKQPDGYAVVLFSKDKLSKAAEFYQDFYKEANIISMNESDESFEMMGSYEGYTITIFASPETEVEDFITNINLIVVEGEMPSLNVGD